MFIDVSEEHTDFQFHILGADCTLKMEVMFFRNVNEYLPDHTAS